MPIRCVDGARSSDEECPQFHRLSLRANRTLDDVCDQRNTMMWQCCFKRRSQGPALLTPTCAWRLPDIACHPARQTGIASKRASVKRLIAALKYKRGARPTHSTQHQHRQGLAPSQESVRRERGIHCDDNQPMRGMSMSLAPLDPPTPVVLCSHALLVRLQHRCILRHQPQSSRPAVVACTRRRPLNPLHQPPDQPRVQPASLSVMGGGVLLTCMGCGVIVGLPVGDHGQAAAGNAGGVVAALEEA